MTVLTDKAALITVMLARVHGCRRVPEQDQRPREGVYVRAVPTISRQNRTIRRGMHLAKAPRETRQRYLAGEFECTLIGEPVVGLFLALDRIDKKHRIWNQSTRRTIAKIKTLGASREFTWPPRLLA